jgi:hypothetical protein
VDLRIQVVFPHDAQGRQQPVSQAPLVNVAVDIFQHGTTLSVRPDFLQAVPSRYSVSLGLQIATGNGPLQSDVSASGASIVPQQTSSDIGGQQYPRWVFNDVPVQPGQQYHFMAILAGLLGNAVTTGNQFSTIWTHAADARTYLPSPQAPPACVPRTVTSTHTAPSARHNHLRQVVIRHPLRDVTGRASRSTTRNRGAGASLWRMSRQRCWCGRDGVGRIIALC